MFRMLMACLALACLLTPAKAGMKVLTFDAGTFKSTSPRAHRRHHRRHHHATAIAVPRCRLVHRENHHIHWRGLACPRISWAGSAPRQPWSYEVFRRHAPWQQRTHLWQSHLRPSPSHPTIYWGY